MQRDLIEAGLSEPAGWRARLWGLCLRRSVRETRSGEARDDLGRVITIGEHDCGRQIHAENAVLIATAANPAQHRIEALSANQTIPTGAMGARCRKAGAAQAPMHHEVSSQKDGRQGVARGGMSRMTMAPPQHGQRSGRRGGMVSWACSAGASGDGTSSSLRQSASLAARWPLARKP